MPERVAPKESIASMANRMYGPTAMERAADAWWAANRPHCCIGEGCKAHSGEVFNKTTGAWDKRVVK